jgi:hypothetical protein
VTPVATGEGEGEGEISVIGVLVII